MSEFVFVEDKHGNSKILTIGSIARGALILNFFSAIKSEFIISQKNDENLDIEYYEWFKEYEDAIKIDLVDITTNIEFFSKLEKSTSLEDQYQLIKSMNPSWSLSFQEYERSRIESKGQWVNSIFLQEFLSESIKYFKNTSVEQTYFFDPNFTVVEFERLLDIDVNTV